MFEDFFTEYDMVKPPQGFKDKINIPEIQENNFIQYPMVTTIDNPTMATDLEDYPGVISPFDILSEEPLRFEIADRPVSSDATNVVNLARLFLNKPYVWGSMDPNKGFDCSGLINYVYRLIGIELPRTSHAMSKVGTEVSLSEVLPGDIIYTSSKGPSGGHVKMVSSVSNGLINVIEAKGRKWGIIESPLTLTGNIKSIRRILGTLLALPAKTTSTGKFNNRTEFVDTLTNTYREVLLEHGLDPNYAYALTSSAAIESAWGTKVSGDFNYGGVKGKTGTVKSTIDWVPGQGNIRRTLTFRDFNSVKDYCNFVVNLLKKDRYRSFSTYPATQPMLFWRHTLESGYGGGSQENINKYMNTFSKVYSLVRGQMA